MTPIVGRPAVESPPPVTIHRFTVEEFHRLCEVGILDEDDRVELLEGWLVPKMVHSPGHDAAIEFLDEALRRVLSAGWRVRIQSSITTADSEPEPDLAIVRGTTRAHASRHPGPEDTALVVEVSDSTLPRDRGTKLRLYARAGVVGYWIVNLPDRQVEVHEGPVTGDPQPSYKSRTVYRVGERVPLILGGQSLGEIAVKDVLP